MATEKAQNLQDTFLNHVRKSKTSVTIFLVNGVKLQGFVTWFDNFCVLLRRDGHSQLVYKHAISTIMPASPITMFEAVEDAGRSLSRLLWVHLAEQSGERRQAAATGTLAPGSSVRISPGNSPARCAVPRRGAMRRSG